MPSFISISTSEEHFKHPFTLPGEKNSSPQELSLGEKIGAVSVGIILGIPSFGILGMIAFYEMTAYFKSRKCQVQKETKIAPFNELLKESTTPPSQETPPPVNAEPTPVVSLPSPRWNKKNLSDRKEQLKNSNTQTTKLGSAEVVRAAKEMKLKQVLGEVISTEKKFHDNCQGQAEIFRKLYEKYPNEEILRKFYALFNASEFDQLKKKIDEVVESQRSPNEMAEELAEFFQSSQFKGYQQAISNMIMLLNDFVKWGGQDKLKEMAIKSKLFDKDTITRMASDFNPSIFMQRILRIQMLFKDVYKNYTGTNVRVKNSLELLSTAAKDINERKKKTEETDNLNQKLVEIKKHFFNAQLKREACVIFISNRFDHDLSYAGVNDLIKDYFFKNYQTIFNEEIEKFVNLKNESKDKHSNKTIITEKLEVQRKLLANLIDYSQAKNLPQIQQTLNKAKKAIDA